jgi:N-acetylglucosamine-6-phosphate deacetylase
VIDVTPEGRLLTAEGWQRGRIFIEDGHILSIDSSPSTALDDPDLPIIVPGFIDLHVHGGGGADVMDGGDALSAIACTHARFGTTCMLATTMTAPLEEIDAALRSVRAYMDRARPNGSARLLGVHLEGPYINRHNLGSQPDFAAPALLEHLHRQCDLAPIRVLTLAPEIEGHDEIIRFLVRRGIRAQIGHSSGTYDEAVAALQLGASGFTHLYNAMSSLHHRAPGIAGAALAHAEYSELIPDLVHVHPGAIRAALRAIPRLYCVTDATAASGMPEGEYHLGRQRVHSCRSGVRLADGTLAGSALTMDQALRNLVAIGLSIEEASARLSLYPADYLGCGDRGRIAVGASADLVVLDRSLRVKDVYIEGERLRGSASVLS